LEGRVLGLDRYGASAPAAEVFKNLGFSVEHIEQLAWDLLNQKLR
jgi:transketolase